MSVVVRMGRAGETLLVRPTQVVSHNREDWETPQEEDLAVRKARAEVMRGLVESFGIDENTPHDTPSIVDIMSAIVKDMEREDKKNG